MSFPSQVVLAPAAMRRSVNDQRGNLPQWFDMSPMIMTGPYKGVNELANRVARSKELCGASVLSVVKKEMNHGEHGNPQRFHRGIERENGRLERSISCLGFVLHRAGTKKWI